MPVYGTATVLPAISQRHFDIQPVDWGTLPTRFMDVNPGELEVLIALFNLVKPTTVIEIGVNEGRTARLALNHVPTIKRYLGVDVPTTATLPLSIQANEIPAEPGKYALDDPRFTLLLNKKGSMGISRSMLPMAQAMFIDGDHSEAGVRYDSQLALATVTSGGVIVWHDYHHHGTVGVPTVLHHLAQQGHALAHIAGTWLAYMIVP